mgnify:CR=1 FL=1
MSNKSSKVYDVGVKQKVIQDIFDEPATYIKVLSFLITQVLNQEVSSISNLELSFTISILQKKCGYRENDKWLYPEYKEIKDSLKWLESKHVIKCKYESDCVLISFYDVICL